jgi:hypothetical protein
MSRDSSVGIATRLRAGQSGFWGSIPGGGLGIFLFTTASKTALWPTQPLTRWVPGALSLGVKRPRREADHTPPSKAAVKECLELYLHSPITSSWRGAQLKKALGQLHLYFYKYELFPICVCDLRGVQLLLFLLFMYLQYGRRVLR